MLSAQDALKIQIFGHSFVKRLLEYIRQSDSWAFSLGLREPHLMQYSGYSGATTSVLGLVVVRGWSWQGHCPSDITSLFAVSVYALPGGYSDVQRTSG